MLRQRLWPPTPHPARRRIACRFSARWLWPINQPGIVKNVQPLPEPSFRRNPVVVGEDAVVPQPVVVEDPALGGQSARALRLGYPDVSEYRRIDGSTSGGWQ